MFPFDPAIAPLWKIHRYLNGAEALHGGESLFKRDKRDNAAGCDCAAFCQGAAQIAGVKYSPGLRAGRGTKQMGREIKEDDSRRYRGGNNTSSMMTSSETKASRSRQRVGVFSREDSVLSKRLLLSPCFSLLLPPSQLVPYAKHTDDRRDLEQKSRPSSTRRIYR